VQQLDAIPKPRWLLEPVDGGLPSGRTVDVTGLPSRGQAEVFFVGGTRFTVDGLVGGIPRLARLLWRLWRTPGSFGARLWYRFPLTLGSSGYFRDAAALDRFTSSPEHQEIVRWARTPGHATAGFVRIFRADAEMPALGEWFTAPESSSARRP
jgi:hypothetical protein